jgi:two-component system, chemotaxis family, CheB/CheR fusion protein
VGWGGKRALDQMATDTAVFGSLIDYLKRTRGFDFHAYKAAGLQRRITKRLDTIGVSGFSDYIDFLEVHPDEFGALFDSILINVTGFFRDPPAWQIIAETVIPAIVSRNRDAIRVWSCGCASGREAYTLAMLLAERLGRKGFREQVKVYATDVDGGALEEARQATYAPAEVEDVPPALLAKYFERTARGYVFDKELRRSVIFGRNDVLQDAPISRLDLLVCRNTLMYFNAEAQARILSRFHFALNDEGFLFLGKAELLLSYASLFTPVEMKARIFAKVPQPGRRERSDAPTIVEPDGDRQQVRLRQIAFDASPVAEILVDANGSVMQANQRARSLLGDGLGEAGRPVVHMELVGRVPGLRGALEQAQDELRPVALRNVDWSAGEGGGALQIDVQVVPLLDGATYDGLSLFILDSTRVRRLHDELTASREQLQSIAEELESTNEELETTNEELQSANEELETANEELQSTNEELETMNEELQLTNEELHAVNDEVSLRGDSLQQANAFLESILRSVHSGVVALDPEMRVTVWNRRAEDLWGLRAEEVRDKHFLSLDIGLPVDELKQPIRACLAGEQESQELVLTASNRRGKSIHCEVTLTPLLPPQASGRGVILLMHERVGQP